jgi:lipoyl(octanoyl) transferase
METTGDAARVPGRSSPPMTAPVLHFHDDAPASGAENMDADRRLLEEAEGFHLRLYSWSPFALSLGYFQDIDPAEKDRLRTAGFEVVRRLTGGGAIFHAHEITYALAGPDGQGPFAGSVEDSYRLIHDLLRDLFLELGVQADYPSAAPRALSRREQPFLCFARCTALDLVIDDRKLVGSAKRRRGGRALQHGSIILRPHPENGEVSGLLDAAPAAIDLAAFRRRFAAELARLTQLSLA